MVTESLSRIYASYIDTQDQGKSTAFGDVKLGKVGVRTPPRANSLGERT